MECPYCKTENRNDRETCYHCGKDISMLRLISNKARHHYNLALEHAERHRYYEAATELRNALDLDSSLVEAHVVLGTVYARLNRPEEARDQWEKALGVSKSHQKAHTYLEQLGQIRPYRGLFRRLRYVLVAFALTAVVCLVLLVSLLWPNVPARRLDRAWRLYQSNNLETAKKTLDEMPRPLKDAGLELSAKSLGLAIEREFQEAIKSVGDFRRQDQPYRAVERANEFLARHPPTPAKETVQQSLQAIRTSLAETLQGQMGELGSSAAGLDQAERALARFFEAFPQAPERESLVKTLARAEAHYASLRLEDVRQVYASSRDSASAILSLKALQAELEEPDSLTAKVRPPTLHDEIQAEIHRIEAEEFEARMAEARRALEQGTLHEAAVALDRAEDVEGPGNERRREVETLREDLKRKEKAARLAALETRLAERDWDAALAAADRLTTVTLDPATRDTVRELALGARRSRAVESYYWLMRRANEIESEPLGADEAREVLRRAQIVLEDLPMRLYPAALDDTLYFLSQAYRALGQDAEARAALERLRRECPKSPYLTDTHADDPGSRTDSPS